QSANLIASASVDFPLPRAPMMQVKPRGILTLRPGRNPPLISIFSSTHMCSTSAGAGTGGIASHPKRSGKMESAGYATLHQKLVRAGPETPAETNAQKRHRRQQRLRPHPNFSLVLDPNGRPPKQPPQAELN